MRSILRLKPYLRPHAWLIAGSALLAIPLSLIRIGPAPLVKYMIDDLLVSRRPRNLLLFPMMVIGLYAINFVVRFFHYYLMRMVITRVNQKIKNELFAHLLGLSADHFTAESTGSLISRVASDPQNIDGGIAAIGALVREPVTLIFALAYTFSLNWRLATVTLLVFPLLAWVFTTTGRNLKRYALKMNESNALLFSTLQESFSGIRVVKLFRLEKYVSTKFQQRGGRYVGFQIKAAAVEEASHPMVEIVSALAIAPILYYGGSQVLGAKMSPGELLGFFTAFALMMTPIRLMNDTNIKLHACAAACERVFTVFDWVPKLYEAPSPVPVSGFRDRIELKSVSFGYPDKPEREVLRNVSLCVERGQTVALVGASGAGKSSLVNLLPRIFDVTKGNILIDGQDIRQFVIDDLRKLIAVVSQDVFLFNDTIEENIRCGRLDATRGEIREAAKRAHALDFIETMHDGFKSRIGDRGQKLSGGERQRISIARAFLREAPILILDEATSSLDSHSERAVQTALNELMLSRTTLVVAHRLSTVRHADLILVLQEGEVVEQGNHAQLLESCGAYSRFLHEGGLLETGGVFG